MQCANIWYLRFLFQFLSHFDGRVCQTPAACLKTISGCMRLVSEFISSHLHHRYVEQDWKSLKWTLIPCPEQLSVPSERAMRVLASEKLPPAELVSFLLDLETPASCLCTTCLVLLLEIPLPLSYFLKVNTLKTGQWSLCARTNKNTCAQFKECEQTHCLSKATQLSTDQRHCLLDTPSPRPFPQYLFDL